MTMRQEDMKHKLCPFSVNGLINGQCDPVRCLGWLQTGIDSDGNGHGMCVLIEAERMRYLNGKRIEDDWGE